MCNRCMDSPRNNYLIQERMGWSRGLIVHVCRLFRGSRGGLLSHGLSQRVREHETPLHQSPINAGGGDGGRAEDRRGGNGRLRQRRTEGRRIRIFVAQRRLKSVFFSAGKTVSLAASALFFPPCHLLQPVQGRKERNVKTRWGTVIKVKLLVPLKRVKFTN